MTAIHLTFCRLFYERDLWGFEEAVKDVSLVSFFFLSQDFRTCRRRFYPVYNSLFLGESFA